MTEKVISGLELIKKNAAATRSGVVFDQISLETGVPRTIELFPHLPEDLQTAIRRGEITLRVDYMGNHKQD
jgi:hypothetical protein